MNLEERIKNAINKCIEKGESNLGAIIFEDIIEKDEELKNIPWDKLQKEMRLLGYPVIEFQGIDFVSSRKQDRDSFEDLLWKYEDELFPGTIHETRSVNKSKTETVTTWKKSPTQEQFYDFLKEVSDQSHISMKFMYIEDDDMPMSVDFNYNDRHIKIEFISEHLEDDKYIIVYIDDSHVEIFRYKSNDHEQLIDTVKRIINYINKN